MRESIRQLVEIVAATLPVKEPIVEFGSFQIPIQVDYADMRLFFPGKEYLGCDMRPGPGVDRIEDLHDITMPTESAGTILILDTLEHVEYPRKALEQVYRVLKPDGIVLVTSVLNYPIHDFPNDYWRFTPEGLKSLLKSFSFCFVDALGEERFPHTVVGLAFKDSVPNDSLNGFTEEFTHWKKQWARLSLWQETLAFLKFQLRYRLFKSIKLRFVRR
jgi:SAM-dependent methyltransferase